LNIQETIGLIGAIFLGWGGYSYKKSKDKIRLLPAPVDKVNRQPTILFRRRRNYRIPRWNGDISP